MKQLECGCPDSTCADGKSCSHPMRRLSVSKSNQPDPSSSTSEQFNNYFHVRNLHHSAALSPGMLLLGMHHADKRTENNNNQVSSTTPNVLIGPRVRVQIQLVQEGEININCPLADVPEMEIPGSTGRWQRGPEGRTEW